MGSLACNVYPFNVYGVNKMKAAPFFSVLFLTACVTINIYFPAAAAEQVADEIIKGIQTEDVQTPEDNDSLLPESRLNDHQPVVLRWIDSVVDVLIPSAQAASADLSVNSAEIRQLRAAMKKRYSALKPFYAKGLVGIKSDGSIVTRGAVPLKDKNKVTKLVAAENLDRQKLYQAIANANGHPEWFAQIKSAFASRWAGNAKAGWWYQSSNGNWKQK